MEKRIFKIGDIDVQISDLGLDCYWTDFETKEIRHMWMNELGLKELCKRINMTDTEYSYTKRIERNKKMKKMFNRT